MKNNTLKRFLALVLSSVMVMTVVGCGNQNQEESKNSEQNSSVKEEENKSSEEEKNSEEEVSPYPEYLNLDGYRPIVKEGEEITLKIAVASRGTEYDVEDTWMYHFIEEKLNINLEVTDISGMVDERKPLMLNSGDLPDILWGIDLTTTEMAQYGMVEGLLLPINKYANETLAPNLLRQFEEYPAVISMCTAPDGNVYVSPYVLNTTLLSGGMMSTNTSFYNDKYLNAVGVTYEELPDTLDGFVDLLRKFAALDPEEMGVDEIIPFAANAAQLNNVLAGAFGWMSGNLAGASYDFESGQIEVPCLTDKFADYVKLIHDMYQEGLVSEDLYTIDQAAQVALIDGGKTAISPSVPYLSTQNWADYTNAIFPMSSEYSDTAVATSLDMGYPGNFIISADTEYPELCIRLLDYLYSVEGSVYASDGPMADSEDTLGIIEGHIWGPNQNGYWVCQDKAYFDPEDPFYNNAGNFRWNRIIVGPQNFNLKELYENQTVIYGESPFPDTRQKEMGLSDWEFQKYCAENDPISNGDRQYRVANYWATWGRDENFEMYSTMPGAYMLEEQNVVYTDIYTSLNSYMTQEMAKFVIGSRSLDELGDFQKELKSIAGDEYLELLRTLYAQYTPVRTKNIYLDN